MEGRDWFGRKEDGYTKYSIKVWKREKVIN
jgi:hypothetical protein